MQYKKENLILEDDPIIDQIEDTLEKVAVFIRRDGGDIHLKGYDKETGTVLVSLSGACQGCMLVDSTITNGVEQILQQEVMGVNKVVVVDDDYNVIETNNPDYGWY